MAIRDCKIVAVEGALAAGKTTLVHALTAHYRSQGVHVACTGEPARSSPYVEEIVIHGHGDFDLACEVDLFAAQLADLVRSARHHQLLIADKTIANVLGYARLVLGAPRDGLTNNVLNAMTAFCRAWAPVYDVVFYLTDHYDPAPATDRHRTRLAPIQEQADAIIRQTCEGTGLALTDVPAGLPPDDKLRWVTSRLTNRSLAGDGGS
jgi:thymidylate kinase